MKRTFVSILLLLVLTLGCLCGCDPSALGGGNHNVGFPCEGCGEMVSSEDAKHSLCEVCDGYFCDGENHDSIDCGHQACAPGEHTVCDTCSELLCNGKDHTHKVSGDGGNDSGSNDNNNNDNNDNNGNDGGNTDTPTVDYTDSAVPEYGVPAYSGEAYVSVNGGVPFFTDAEKSNTAAFETYSPLDALGRCGVAYANVCKELMPTTPREDGLSDPSGWKYNGKSNNNIYSGSIVSGGYIYNRCHLIGWQLAGENNNKQNLITGTKMLNIEGMLPFENQVADYVKETNNHVLYRVTPVFKGDNLVASGVLIEAWSVEDEGDGICICVYSYNVQDHVEINYLTGENKLASGSVYDDNDKVYVFILNTNSSSHKIHLSTCKSIDGWENKSHMVRFEGTLTELFEQYDGYSQCGNCKPITKAEESQ